MGDNTFYDDDEESYKDDDIYMDEEPKKDEDEEDEADEQFDKQEARKKRRKIINRVILIVAACVFIFSAYKLIDILLEYKKGTDTYNAVENDVIIDDQQSVILQDESGQQTSVDIPFVYDEAALKAINQYAIGYMYIPSINLRLPMVQYSDNDYYLHHLIDGTYNANGCLFEDYRITDGINSSHVIIYGHNMNNGSMFGLLKYYRNASYYQTDNNNKIYIYTGDELREYTIFSCYQSEPISDTYTYNFSDVPTMRAWAERMKGQSLYDTGVNISNSNQVLTLSTCTSDGKDRFIVHATHTGTAKISKTEESSAATN